MKEMKVRITFTEEVLGTASGNSAIHEEFIASKAPDAPSREEEVEAIGVEAEVEKSKTVFPKDENGNPIFWDYQIKGFFKDSCSALKKATGFMSNKLTAHKKAIDGRVFVFPRQIPIMYDGAEIKELIADCQRPLRAQTAQGERVALANSETVPAGSYIDITIKCLEDGLTPYVEEWLDYGELRGIGQWRNSGKGRFNWEYLED